MKESIKIRRRQQLFRDRPRLTKKVVQTLRRAYRVRKGFINGEPAREVIEERLNSIPGPELRLLAAFVLGDDMPDLRDCEGSIWMDAIQDRLP